MLHFSPHFDWFLTTWKCDNLLNIFPRAWTVQGHYFNPTQRIHWNYIGIKSTTLFSTISFIEYYQISRWIVLIIENENHRDVLYLDLFPFVIIWRN